MVAATDTDTSPEALVHGPPAPDADVAEVEAPEAGELTHVVLRPIFADGSDRCIGEVVDASNWRSAERLCDMRYLRPLLRDDQDPVSDGERHFISDDALLAFYEAQEADADPDTVQED